MGSVGDDSVERTCRAGNILFVGMAVSPASAFHKKGMCALAYGPYDSFERTACPGGRPTPSSEPAVRETSCTSEWQSVRQVLAMKKVRALWLTAPMIHSNERHAQVGDRLRRANLPCGKNLVRRYGSQSSKCPPRKRYVRFGLRPL